MRPEFPKIMGILNVTPDSFSDGGLFVDQQTAIIHSLKMIDNGAEIIDIGGESTKPGSLPVSEEVELSRVIPIIKVLKHLKPNIKVSIDTTKYNVAKAAIQEGASMINDVSGLNSDLGLAELAAENNTDLIIMHCQGNPQNMQLNPSYNNVVDEVFQFLKDKIDIAKKIGCKSVIADVGIGFGKTIEHNLELLRNLPKFKELDVPISLGISRKRFIGNLLNIENPIERDIPTALLHSLLLSYGVDIIRVHNVKMISMLKVLYEALG